MNIFESVNLFNTQDLFQLGKEITSCRYPILVLKYDLLRRYNKSIKWGMILVTYLSICIICFI